MTKMAHKSYFGGGKKLAKMRELQAKTTLKVRAHLISKKRMVDKKNHSWLRLGSFIII